MTKANYDIRPSAIEAVGNGSYLYRWDIEQVELGSLDGAEQRVSWNCNEVTIWNEPTENAITERVIDVIWGSGVEQKLINDYQAAQLGLLDESCAVPYTEFLAQRKALKDRISDDFTLWKSAT